MNQINPITILAKELGTPLMNLIRSYFNNFFHKITILLPILVLTDN